MKSSSTVPRFVQNEDGTEGEHEVVQITETETELPPNTQALSTLLFHYDSEWREMQHKMRHQNADEGKEEEQITGIDLNVAYTCLRDLEMQEKILDKYYNCIPASFRIP